LFKFIRALPELMTEVFFTESSVCYRSASIVVVKLLERAGLILV